MIRNYFKIAWRNLWKNKLFSFINIIGLGLALPFALLSIMQVVNVFESDNFHPYPDRTYRIITDVEAKNGTKEKYAISPASVAERLQRDYPFVEQTTHVVREFGWELNNRIKNINVQCIYIEPQFFNLFGFALDKGTVPVEPNTLAITAEKAAVFFGEEDAIGKTLTHPDYGDFKITGILKPFKRSTHLRSDVMVSIATYKKFNKQIASTTLSGFSYVRIKPIAQSKQIDASLDAIAVSMNSIDAHDDELHFRKQLVSEISPGYEELQHNSYVESLLDLAVNFAFALAILLLAGFNYINLTLARSISRAKEVGVRKVAGALRHQLILQFICEAVVVALLSLVVGFVSLKTIERFSYVNWFMWEVDHKGLLWFAFVLFTMAIGILAGFIPARILSKFQPVKVLKGNISPGSFGKMGFRNTLVVLQFVVTACFIFALATMYSQFKYMATDNDNFNRQNIYNVSVGSNYQLLLNNIATHKNVERVGLVSIPLGGATAQCYVKKDAQENNLNASYYAANADFISNMNLIFMAGSNLPNSISDSASNFIVINEQAVAALGLGTVQEAVGKAILLNNKQVIIHGVLKNFCYYVYQWAPNPLVMQYNPQQFRVLSIKTTSPVDEAGFKHDLKGIWKKHFPNEEFVFSNYQKDLYDRYYPGADMKFMGMFCVVVLAIAIMGLIGIVTYGTEKRIREIGIRKVMGAKVSTIVLELSKSFLKLMLIAASIAIPIGYIGSYFLVSLFAFNNGVNLVLLILLFLSIFILALLVIIIQSRRAAAANPIHALRSE